MKIRLAFNFQMDFLQLENIDYFRYRKRKTQKLSFEEVLWNRRLQMYERFNLAKSCMKICFCLCYDDSILDHFDLYFTQKRIGYMLFSDIQMSPVTLFNRFSAKCRYIIYCMDNFPARIQTSEWPYSELRFFFNRNES